MNLCVYNRTYSRTNGTDKTVMNVRNYFQSKYLFGSQDFRSTSDRNTKQPQKAQSTFLIKNTNKFLIGKKKSTSIRILKGSSVLQA